MTTIAFDGGSSVCELGSSEDVVAFFTCLNRFVVTEESPSSYQLLTDRLYRRFLRSEDLNAATEDMVRVKEEFQRVLTADVDWGEMGVSPRSTRLDLEMPTLAGVFKRFFACFEHCVQSARTNQEAFSTYPGYRFEPVRIVVADQPWFLVEKQRSLEEYELLQGDPFWLR